MLTSASLLQPATCPEGFKILFSNFRNELNLVKFIENSYEVQKLQMTYQNSQKNEIYTMELCLCAFGPSHFSDNSFCDFIFVANATLSRIHFRERGEPD